MKKVILPLFFLIILSYSAFVARDDIVSVFHTQKAKAVCIIDAGHGGFDGGASGFDGTKEKDLNLQMAKKLQDILILNDYETVMIRNDDISVEEAGDSHKKKGDIRKRLKVARENPEALFISIHQNSYRDESQKGLQVFYGRKNKESPILASCIQDSVRSSLQQDNKRAVKLAGDNIFLLKNMENVSCMVECGFITNKEELKLLKDEAYQQKLMLAVFQGIENYLGREGE